jgi:hypothetical protein
MFSLRRNPQSFTEPRRFIAILARDRQLLYPELDESNSYRHPVSVRSVALLFCSTGSRVLVISLLQMFTSEPCVLHPLSILSSFGRSNRTLRTVPGVTHLSSLLLAPNRLHWSLLTGCGV